MADATVDAEILDYLQDDVFGVHTLAEFALKVDPADFLFVSRNAVGRQHVPYLGGADPDTNRTKGSVGYGVAVTAGDGHPWLGETEFGRDNVVDTLFARLEAEEGDAVLARIRFERAQHLFGLVVLQWAFAFFFSVGAMWSVVATVWFG